MFLSGIHFGFMVFFIFFLVLRFLNLFTALEWVTDFEELLRGTIGKEIIEGLKFPLLDYQADAFSGGSIAMGIAAVPFFLIFGYSLFALKLAVFIFFAVPACILFIFFLYRYFGEKAALAGGLLYIWASPPALVAGSFMAMGYHAQSIPFSLGILICFYEFLYGPKKKRDLYLGLFGFWEI